MRAIVKPTNRVSPEDYLEGEKLAEFRHEYVVEQDRAAATVLLKADQGWQIELLEGLGSVLKLLCISVEIPLEWIYERTSLAGASKQNR